MKLNRTKNLFLCSLGLSFGILSGSMGSSHGAGILTEIKGSSMIRKAVSVAISTQTLRNMYFPSRNYSDIVFKGKYVSSSSDGIVTIKQARYPKYSGVQYLRLNPKIISELKIDKGNGMPYHLVDFNDLEGPFEGTPRIETIIDANFPFTIISSDRAETKPYSSTGRLEMFFPKGDKESGSSYYGSGAALDKNLVISAAHNFLPPTFNDHPNTGRTMAEEVRFHHMLTTATFSKDRSVRSARVSTHCFIHPEWRKNFNPAYDVALVFLSESLDLTQAQIDELLKLKVLNVKEETLRIVGHPDGSIHMSESYGKARGKQTVDSKNIIYHFANTLPGSSGSPIISEDLHMIGTHTRGAGYETDGANSGVRMRLELLPFIDDSIARHQEFLDHMDEIEKFQQKEKQRQEQVLIDQGITQGIAQGIAQGEKIAQIKLARKLLIRNRPISEIVEDTGLTEKEIIELR